MLMDVPKIKSAQDAAELATEIECMESSLKMLKSELKRFVDQNDAVETADKCGLTMWRSLGSFMSLV